MEPAITDYLPDAIYQYFKANTMTGIASTIDDDGYPRGAPMSMFYALDERTVLMAVQNHSRTFLNAQQRGKIALSFIGSGDQAFTIQADARLFKQQMRSSKHIGILLLSIRTVKNNTADDVEIKEGIQLKFRSPAWKEYIFKILNELRSYSLSDSGD